MSPSLEEPASSSVKKQGRLYCRNMIFIYPAHLGLRGDHCRFSPNLKGAGPPLSRDCIAGGGNDGSMVLNGTQRTITVTIQLQSWMLLDVPGPGPRCDPQISETAARAQEKV